MAWKEMIKSSEITGNVTDVKFAEDFGKYLGTNDSEGSKLTTNQLRKFFGEIKRQQMQGFNKTDFVLLKPKLAYAVGRTKNKNAKIVDFYRVMSDAIDKVQNEQHFKNFIKIFEAIVAYHKAAEENISIE